MEAKELVNRLQDLDIQMAADLYESAKQSRENKVRQRAIRNSIRGIKKYVESIKKPPIPMAILMVVGFILTALAIVEAFV